MTSTRAASALAVALAAGAVSASPQAPSAALAPAAAASARSAACHGRAALADFGSDGRIGERAPARRKRLTECAWPRTFMNDVMTHSLGPVCKTVRVDCR